MNDKNQTEPVKKDYIPLQPKNSFRVVITMTRSGERLDAVLLKSLREQKENLNLFNISRMAFKELFANGKITIKGQKAKPSSTLAKGDTYIDILGMGTKTV